MHYCKELIYIKLEWYFEYNSNSKFLVLSNNTHKTLILIAYINDTRNPL